MWFSLCIPQMWDYLKKKHFGCLSSRCSTCVYVMEKSMHFMHLLKHTKKHVRGDEKHHCQVLGKNSGILENVFCKQDKAPATWRFCCCCSKLKIVMKQLLLVSWMFCFHLKILLLSLELFLFCIFFSIINIFLNTFYIKRKKGPQTFKYVKVTTAMYWAFGSMSPLELKFLQLEMGTSVNRQTPKPHEIG